MAQKALNGVQHLKQSSNEYDWLGHGIYFWENDPVRAYEFARKTGKKNPAVIGAIIDLGNCLSLMERDAIKLLRSVRNTDCIKGYFLPLGSYKTRSH